MPLARFALHSGCCSFTLNRPEQPVVRVSWNQAMAFCDWLSAKTTASPTHKTVRGGSWLDCPNRARAVFRNHYDPSQAIHDVGFRVICELENP